MVPAKDELPPGLGGPPLIKKARTQDKVAMIKCPYLDTINRHLLDFDFDKVCSQTLSALNVYCCLVCGKFYQGRGKQTQAYTHSTMTGHHMFINLETCRIYCLPDNYEVADSSLDDIKRCLRPEYVPREISSLDSNTTLARDVHGVAYLPGFCGLNNLRHTDYINVVVHALAHVPPLRDFFLANSDPALVAASRRHALVRKFGELLRKMWSKDNFKSVISPHAFVQEVTVASKLKFAIGRQADAVEFLSWLLNTLKKQLKPSTIIDRTFRGEIHVETLSRRTHLTKRDENEVDENAEERGWTRTDADSNFLYLTLDIPATPLFKDSQGGNIIPQIPLFDVLAKYNGVKLADSVRAGVQSRKRYFIKRLPPFLVFHFGRFSKNNFYSEKNPTIVNFPVKNLDLADQFAFDPTPDYSTKYDLLANVCHDLPAGLGKDAQQDPLQYGTYRVHLRQPSSNQWYEIQDLHVSETMPQLIGLSESLMCIYIRQGIRGSTVVPSSVRERG